MIYDMVPENSAILKTKMERFDFSNPSIDPSELARNLTETMLHYNGVGLAANQCGLPYRIFVIKSNPVIACFNPIIVATGDKQVLLEEGCLSYPGFYIKIKRPQAIKIRFTMPNGETVTNVYSGLTARCIMHEYDHLEGLSFKARATQYHRDKANKDYKLYLRRKK